VTLKHRRTAAIEFGLERGDDCGMVMPDVVDAVSGEEVENATAIRGVQFSTHAARVSHIHLKQIKKPHPLRIDVISVTGGGFHRCCRHRDLGQKRRLAKSHITARFQNTAKEITIVFR
jgi:hypothetical protein